MSSAIAAFAVVALAAAGCGSDKESSSTTQPAAASSSSTVAGPTTTPSSGSSLATSTSTPAPSGEPIRFGAVQAITGTLAALGQDSVNGLQLAIDEVNASGGVLGRPVELTVEDTATDPTVSLNAFTKLTTEGDIDILFGENVSAPTAAAKDLIDKAGIPHFVNGASAVSLVAPKGSEWTFLVNDRDADKAQVIIDAIKNHYKVTNIGVVISTNSPPGVTVAGLIQDGLKDSGVKVTVAESVDQTDFSTQLTRLRDAGAQLVVASGTAGDALGFLVRQASDLGMSDVPIVGIIYADSLQEIAGDASANYAFTTPYVPEMDSKEAVAFREAYVAKYGSEPTKTAVIGYTVGHIAAAAVELAGTTDPVKVREAVRNVDWVGPWGIPKFDEFGAWFVQTFLAHLVDGQVVPL